MKKDVQMGGQVQVSFMGRDGVAYFYQGVVVGFTRLKDLHTGESSEGYLVAVQCNHCRVVESVPERVVEPLSRSASGSGEERLGDKDTDPRLGSVGGAKV